MVEKKSEFQNQKCSLEKGILDKRRGEISAFIDAVDCKWWANAIPKRVGPRLSFETVLLHCPWNAGDHGRSQTFLKTTGTKQLHHPTVLPAQGGVSSGPGRLAARAAMWGKEWPFLSAAGDQPGHCREMWWMLLQMEAVKASCLGPGTDNGRAVVTAGLKLLRSHVAWSLCFPSGEGLYQGFFLSYALLKWAKLAQNTCFPALLPFFPSLPLYNSTHMAQ